MSHRSPPALTVVITGASSGIGAEAARQLARRGSHLVLTARRAAELDAVADACRALGAGSVHCHVCDLADPAANDRFCTELLASHERIDVLINNAGRSIRRSLSDSTERPHDFERTMQINYLAPVRTTLRLLPRFRQQGCGQVINVSSVAALMISPRFAAYLASKAALDAFTRSLRIELASEGIVATSVNFPLVRTAMTEPTALYRYLPQMDVSDAAGWLLRAIDQRPARLAPRLVTAFHIAIATAPAPALKWLGRYYQRRLDKAAARMQQAESPDR